MQSYTCCKKYFRLLLNWIKVYDEKKLKTHLMWADDTRLDSNYSKDRKSLDMSTWDYVVGCLMKDETAISTKIRRIIPSIIEDLLVGNLSGFSRMFINLWTKLLAIKFYSRVTFTEQRESNSSSRCFCFDRTSYEFQKKESWMKINFNSCHRHREKKRKMLKSLMSCENFIYACMQLFFSQMWKYIFLWFQTFKDEEMFASGWIHLHVCNLLNKSSFYFSNPAVAPQSSKVQKKHFVN